MSKSISDICRELASNIEGKAASAVAELAGMKLEEVESKNLFRESGGFPFLIDLLKDDNPEIKFNSASAISSLCSGCSKNRSEVQRLGVIPLLVQMLTQDNPASHRKKAASALWNICDHHDAAKNEVRGCDGLRHLVNLLFDTDSEVVCCAMGAIHVLVHGNEFNQNSLRDAGGISPLLDFLKRNNYVSASNEAVQRTRGLAADALHSLSFNATNRILIANLGAIPLMASLLSDANLLVRRGSAGVLNTLAVEEQNRPLIGISGAMPQLISMLKDEDELARANSAAALANICANNAANKAMLISNGGANLLVDLLRDRSHSCRKQASVAIRNVASCPTHRRILAQYGAMGLLANLLQDPDPQTREAAALAIRNMTTESAENMAQLRGAIALNAQLRQIHQSDLPTTVRIKTSIFGQVGSAAPRTGYEPVCGGCNLL